MKIETSFIRLKKAILELKDGYPEYAFYGKIEYFVKTGKWAVDLLDKHGIIEKVDKEEAKMLIEKMRFEKPEEYQKLMKLSEEDRFRWYRLTAKGVDLAIAMINLEYAEEMKLLTYLIALLTLINLLITANGIILSIIC